MAQWEKRTGTAVDRLLFFSDAVVAVAITVLALPLFDIPGPKDGENVLDVISAHQGQIITFIVTFVVMAVMWNIHNRVMNSLYAYDAVIFWLDMFWLIGFVFLPWPSTMYGAGDHWGSTDVGVFSSDGTGALYWWTMAYISGIGTIVSLYINRRPEFIKPNDRAYWAALSKTRARLRGAAFFVVFIVAGLTTVIYPFLGYWALLLIWPLNIILQPTKAQRAELDSLRAPDREAS
ncbi:MAG: TMEM175 family protein [Candidatus Nanopelagicales bacterium]|jgi:uncharacterized membrane protein